MVLFWVQTVSKGYQQKTKSLLAGKGFKGIFDEQSHLESLNIDVLSADLLFNLFAACVDVPVINISVISGHFVGFLGEPGFQVIKLFSYSTQLSMKFILLINVKMPTIVGILTFNSIINTTSERLKARHFFICRYFSFYEQLKFHAQLS